VFVQDVIDDASEVLGYCQESVLFRRLTDAIEVLANKGQWDPLLGYLDITTDNSYFVTLPREVESPLKININGNPSFSRSRLYEFTLNGPGNEMPETTGFAWDDQGDTPFFIKPQFPTRLSVQPLDPADVGKTVTIVGVSQATGQTTKIVMELGVVAMTEILTDVVSISKPQTQGSVNVHDGNSNLLATYAPSETEPRYRRIKLSKKAAAVHMLYRRVTHKVVSVDDFIPLHSKMALLLMLKSLEAYRREDFANAQAFEQQSLKLISEEQQSRNAYQLVAKQSEDDTATGSTYRDASILLVSDVYDDASKIFGPIGRAKLFDRITDAIQLLANKGNWDPMLAYLDIKVGLGNVIVLPDEVEVPLAININNEPSFARNRMFEFTLNTPGSTMQDTAGFAWDDRGTVPIFATLKTPQKLHALAEDPSDNDKKLKVIGRDNKNRRIEETLTINASVMQGQKTFAKIDRVEKDVTTGFVQLKIPSVSGATSQDDLTTDILSRYYPDETDPQYRAIKLSVTAPAVRMLFQRKTKNMKALTDIIPLGSKLALMMALRAVAAHMAGKSDEGKKLEDTAAAMLIDQQKSHNSMAISPELSATNQTISARDEVIVADVYDDAAQIFGMIGKLRLFDKITEALEALANESQWDGLVGYVDIMTDCENFVTLPRYVETPLAINLCGSPLQPRNQFFEFHLNGPGSHWQPCHTWYSMDDVCTLRDPSAPHQLIATAEFTNDIGARLRVYGYDAFGRRIRTPDPDNTGKQMDGAYIPVAASPSPNPNAPFFQRIERVEKSITKGHVTLYSYRPPVGQAAANLLKIGLYQPDETQPSYKRIRLPVTCASIRMRYRKRTIKVSGMQEPLHLKSKTAIVQMMKAVRSLDKEEYDKAGIASKLAVEILTKEQQSRNPTDTFSFQFDTRVHGANKRAQGIR
jgi:hypothetical protein